MKLTNLTPKDLAQIASLIKRRDQVVADLAKIDSALAVFEGAASRGTVKSPGGQPGTRRKIKGEILAVLQTTGKEGISVREVADRLGVDVNRIFTWFYATGRKIKNIKKVGEARYRWDA